MAHALVDKADFLAGLGADFEVVAVADSDSVAIDRKGLGLKSLIQTKEATGKVGNVQMSALDLIREVESDTVVELTPANPKSGEPALSHLRAALESSKNVVTANKMPLALRYSELTYEASRRGVMLLYSACVGGGVPMLEFGRICGRPEEIDGFDAILNATSNFILTEMQEEEMDYKSALAEAQKLGFAESDPTVDVEGFDAAAKLVILANHVMGRRISLKDVRPLVGIGGIAAEDLKAAASKGMQIRPLASMRLTGEVGPREVKVDDPVNVRGATNSIVFHCRDSGDRVMTGQAGGSVATSRGVLRDLVAIARDSI